MGEKLNGPRGPRRPHGLREGWKRHKERLKEAEEQKRPGPPNAFALLPWLLLGLGSFSNLIGGDAPNPWIGGAGLLAFNSLYVSVAFRAFDPEKRKSHVTLYLLGLMAAITYGLALGYGDNWLLFFPLLSLAIGTTLRDRQLGLALVVVAGSAGYISGQEGHSPWDPWTLGYGTFISGAVTAAVLTLSETVMELRSTRQELARSAVEQERLRFSRDLHDLLGHTLSVIVVKSEAARRIAPRDMEAALGQISDIETVGRQALTEIREAVTGYRDASLASELDRARSALTAAGIEPVVRQSGPPLAPENAALLGWVVRESVTNAVRHSGATRCQITVDGGAPERVRLVIKDNGRGVGSTPPGSGLKGLTERLAAAGGSLEAGPGQRSGFRLVAELPADAAPDREEPAG
ncbi:sensor histidine kinase [Streptomyces sp. NBC_01387]|uniref:sensor histidine kinase n=1 Tax=unclassified Streptomyces TaxID=2593676 RepID=UPI002024B83B|nr:MULTISPECIES: sensor histidine kinase [unclassified Streptomyces]MCX4551419.1 sensor histidine kinase [Streptomyces sp. NBC_01500]WSC22812.1 sensor histidine kinase [Streptomyces sp. NBC_01766]WSV56724.1 sensor histidine kinase [Streptomyces sp. NBC_01014]